MQRGLSNLMPQLGNIPPQTHSGVPIQVEIPKVIGRNKELSIDKTITIIPVVRITTPVLIEKWIESEAYLRILDFIMSLNTSCMNIKSSDDTLLSDNVKKVLSMLDIIDTFVDEIPPDQSSQRFGNTAFRTWITKLRQTPTLHTFVPDKFQHFIPEIELYIFGSFGDQTRLDYGSGHELSFVAWLACLDLLGLFTICDYPSLVTKVFTRYLKICRRIQLTYNLEPAGSHGVWGLDDYQFLPYYWGSSQLIDHSINDQELVEHFADEYLYLGCINYINKVKKGPFGEHSPILYDISGVIHWTKVNGGMIKMFLKEVLQKYPVIQHFLFGALLPFEPACAILSNSADKING